jgi:photosystem II stability/assembly factor-like uncharacterized protein
MNRVVFTSQEKGYAVGENNGNAYGTKPNFLRTSNGGETWVNLTSHLPAATAWGSYNDIEGLSARGDDVWIALSLYYPAKGLLLHSDNRGMSWTIEATNSSTGFSSVSMADEKHGWATSDDHALWRTTNGHTWSVVGWTIGSPEQVFAVNKHQAVIVEDGGHIEYTTNGTTLYTATLPAQVNGNDLTDVAIGDDGKGYATGELNGYLLATKNGGRTWTWQNANTPIGGDNTFNGVTVAKDTNFAWITGEGGAVGSNTTPGKSCDK